MIFIGSCRTIKETEKIVKVVTIIDTIRVDIEDTIIIKNTIDSIIIDTLHQIIKDTILVEKLIKKIEENIHTELSLDTNIVKENRIIHLSVRVKDNKIGVKILSNGLLNNEVELIPTKNFLPTDWYIFVIIGFIGGIVCFFILRTFTKWLFGFK